MNSAVTGNIQTQQTFSPGVTAEGDKFQIAKMEFWIAKIQFSNLEFGTAMSDSKTESDKQIIHDADYLFCIT